jgi:hypothetical protein
MHLFVKYMPMDMVTDLGTGRDTDIGADIGI